MQFYLTLGLYLQLCEHLKVGLLSAPLISSTMKRNYQHTHSHYYTFITVNTCLPIDFPTFSPSKPHSHSRTRKLPAAQVSHRPGNRSSTGRQGIPPNLPPPIPSPDLPDPAPPPYPFDPRPITANQSLARTPTHPLSSFLSALPPFLSSFYLSFLCLL